MTQNYLCSCGKSMSGQKSILGGRCPKCGGVVMTKSEGKRRKMMKDADKDWKGYANKGMVPVPENECANCGCQKATHPIPSCKEFVPNIDLRTTDTVPPVYLGKKTIKVKVPVPVREETDRIGIDLVDEIFPKGECKERGKAILLYAKLNVEYRAHIKKVRDGLMKSAISASNETEGRIFAYNEALNDFVEELGAE
jgi:DNA-directed RNA polymerase subunit RPC12/RpoP